VDRGGRRQQPLSAPVVHGNVSTLRQASIAASECMPIARLTRWQETNAISTSPEASLTLRTAFPPPMWGIIEALYPLSSDPMIPRTLFTPEHETFRDSVRRFLEAEVKPNDERWQEQGYADKSVWKKAGENGFLCMSMPEEHGGSGADRLFSMVLIEEQARINNSTLGWGLHSEIVARTCSTTAATR